MPESEAQRRQREALLLAQLSSYRGPFVWSPARRVYLDASGTPVPSRLVNEALDDVIRQATANMRSLTERLAAGDLSIAQWQAQMAVEIKTVHLVAASVGRGGWRQMSQADYGWVGQRIRGQYAYLKGFAEQIGTGQQPLGAQAEARAELYGNASRATQREMERRIGAQMGDAWEQNVLGIADSCNGCLDATDQGWVPIGTLPPIGTRDCQVNCHCVIETSRTQGDEEQAA